MDHVSLEAYSRSGKDASRGRNPFSLPWSLVIMVQVSSVVLVPVEDPSPGQGRHAHQQQQAQGPDDDRDAAVLQQVAGRYEQ